MFQGNRIPLLLCLIGALASPACFTSGRGMMMPPPLMVTNTAPPAALAGQAFSFSIQVTGGTAPYTLTETTMLFPAGMGANGTPCQGLMINFATGAVTGTPVNSGTCGPVNFTVTDSSTPALTFQFSLTFPVAGILAITSATLPNGTEGVAYNQTVATSGGSTPLAFSISAGALPPGLMLSATTGAITGTPTTGGTFNFTVRATDSLTPAQAVTQAYTVLILQITTTSLPLAILGQPYSETLTADGAILPAVWTLAPGSGPLPNGIMLSAAGQLSGIPMAEGQFPLIFEVTDAGNPARTHQRMLVLTVLAPLVITTALPDGVQGTPYGPTGAGVPFQATGGLGPATFSVGGGVLPPGLNLANGVLQGTPTQGGFFAFTIDATDQLPQTASNNYLVRILEITTLTLPDGVEGQPYSHTLTVTGEVPAGTWALAPGSQLPPNLILDPMTGILSGTPAQAGLFGFTVQATDSGNPPRTHTRALTLQINAPPLPANLNVVFSSDPPTIAQGDPVNLRAVVTSDGGAALINVAMDFLLPSEITAASVTIFQGTASCSQNQQMVSCTVNRLDGQPNPQSVGVFVTGNGTQTGTFDSFFNVTATDESSGQPLSVNQQVSTTVAPPTVTSVTVTPNFVVIPADSQQTFTATATFSDGSTSDVSTDPGTTWTSSLQAVATISGNGIASPVSHGSTTITATFQGVSGTATLDVVVAIHITPTMATVPAGGQAVFTVDIIGDPAHAGAEMNVNTVVGGNSIIGTVISPAAVGTSQGPSTYTAPAMVPAGGMVTVGACANADLARCAFAQVTVAANQPPMADFTFAVDANNPLLVHFDGTNSFDPDSGSGDFISHYQWDFGDGNSATGATTQHAYTAPGTYTVSLTVTDSFGLTHSTTQQVTVTAPNLQHFNSFPTTATVGHFTAFPMELRNNGNRDATGVQDEFRAPAVLVGALRFDSATSSKGTFTESNGVVTFSIGTLAVGEVWTATVNVIPTVVALPGLNITTTASLNEPDANPIDNTVTTFVAMLPQPLFLTPPPLPDGIVGTFYSHDVLATGQVDRLKWTYADAGDQWFVPGPPPPGQPQDHTSFMGNNGACMGLGFALTDGGLNTGFLNDRVAIIGTPNTPGDCGPFTLIAEDLTTGTIVSQTDNIHINAVQSPNLAVTSTCLDCPGEDGGTVTVRFTVAENSGSAAPAGTFSVSASSGLANVVITGPGCFGGSSCTRDYTANEVITYDAQADVIRVARGVPQDVTGQINQAADTNPADDSDTVDVDIIWLEISPVNPTINLAFPPPNLQFTATLKVTGVPPINNDVTTSVDWDSSDMAVATIQTTGDALPGLATALTTGTTTISAFSTFGATSDWTTLTVINAASFTGPYAFILDGPTTNHSFAFDDTGTLVNSDSIVIRPGVFNHSTHRIRDPLTGIEYAVVIYDDAMGNSFVKLYEIAADGSLTEVSPEIALSFRPTICQTVTDSGSGSASVLVLHDGAGGSGTHSFRIGLASTPASVTPLPVTPILVGANVTDLTAHPSGNYLAAAADGQLRIFVTQADGSFPEHANSPYSFTNPVTTVAFNPAGTSVCLSESGFGLLCAPFDLATGDVNTGMTTSVPVPTAYITMADLPDGRPLIVASDPIMFTFTMTITGGVLTPTGPPLMLLSIAPKLVTGPNSEMFLGRLNQFTSTLEIHTVDPATGTINPAAVSVTNLPSGFPDSWVFAWPF